MKRHSAQMETVPHSLEAISSRSSTASGPRSFAGIVAEFFRKNGSSGAQAAPSPCTSPPAATAPGAAQVPHPVANPVLHQHWNAIKADGISASQFIAFLQPLADLDGISVSYSYSDEDGKAHVYTRRRDEAAAPGANPLSEAIRKGKLSREKALTFALNEEGRVWIESNFLDLK